MKSKFQFLHCNVLKIISNIFYFPATELANSDTVSLQLQYFAAYYRSRKRLIVYTVIAITANVDFILHQSSTAYSSHPKKQLYNMWPKKCLLLLFVKDSSAQMLTYVLLH